MSTYDFLFARLFSKKLFLSYVLLGASALGLLLLIEPHYMQQMIETDFMSLYRSYQRTKLDYIFYFLSRLGLFLLFASSVGFVVLWQKTALRPKTSLIILTAIFWLLLWVFGPAQIGTHYLIVFWPLFLSLGLVALLHHVSLRVRLALIVFFMLHALYSFWPQKDMIYPNDPPPPLALFATPHPPWQRPDRQEISALMTALDKQVKENDRVLFAGSSFVFNQDFMQACWAEQNPQNAWRMIPAPEIDHMQKAPLDALASANIYIVPDKPQLHLPPKGQKNVSALWQSLQDLTKQSSFIKKTSRDFTLDRDTHLSIFKRAPWTPGMLHKALSSIKTASGSKRRWIISKMPAQGAFDDTPKGLLYRGALLSPSSSTQLFYDQPLTRGDYFLSFSYNLWGNLASFLIEAHDEKGALLYQKALPAVTTRGNLSLPLSFSKLKSNNIYITLSLLCPQGQICAFALSELSTKKEKF